MILNATDHIYVKVNCHSIAVHLTLEYKSCLTFYYLHTVSSRLYSCCSSPGKETSSISPFSHKHHQCSYSLHVLTSILYQIAHVGLEGGWARAISKVWGMLKSFKSHPNSLGNLCDQNCVFINFCVFMSVYSSTLPGWFLKISHFSLFFTICDWWLAWNVIIKLLWRDN